MGYGQERLICVFRPSGLGIADVSRAVSPCLVGPWLERPTRSDPSELNGKNAGLKIN